MAIEQKKKFISENLRAEDLSMESQAMLELIGRDRYIEMCEKLGGSTVVIPKVETLNCISAKRAILENADTYKSMGITNNQLAAMYGISTSSVYNILKKADK